MHVGELLIPKELSKLIETGWWPTKENELNQNLRCLISREKVKLIDKECDVIYFFPPPFLR